MKMGRIKGTLVKRVTKVMINRNSDKFTSNFDENKKILISILPTQKSQKKFRNSIAGYITRIIKRQQKKKKH